MVAGFERIESGVVRLGAVVFDDGRTSLPPERRRIGYVPQDGALFPHLRVAANVGFGLPRSSRRKVGALLDAVGLTGLERRYPHQLSGGQQQRVALARALAIEPEVVLLDEPFSSLDAALRASVRQEVAQILRARGTTTVLVTHDQDEALSMADRVAVLRDGRIVADARPEDLYRSPLDADLAGFRRRGQPAARDHRGRGGPHRPRAGWCCRIEVTAGWPGADPAAVVLVRPEQLEVRSRTAGAGRRRDRRPGRRPGLLRPRRRAPRGAVGPGRPGAAAGPGDRPGRAPARHRRPAHGAGAGHGLAGVAPADGPWTPTPTRSPASRRSAAEGLSS